MYFTILFDVLFEVNFRHHDILLLTIPAASLQTKGIVLYNHHPLTAHTKIIIVLAPYSNPLLCSPNVFCDSLFQIRIQIKFTNHVWWLYFFIFLNLAEPLLTSFLCISIFILLTSRGPVECPAFWNCLITCSLSHLPWFLTPIFPVSWKLNKIQLRHFWQNNFIDDAAGFKANCRRIHMKMHH